MKNARCKVGFTLIELSIVLVIIGLIVGGVVGGKSLIESARIQGVIHEFIKYDTAFTSFYTTYDAYAGDFSEASDYWSPGVPVYNGGGNGSYDNDVNDGYRAWQHLTLAGMTPGEYCGSVLCGGGVMNLGVNAPRSEYNKEAGWLASDQLDLFGSTGIKYIRLGAPSTNSNWGHAVVGRHSKAIDRKFDDGEYNSGKVVVFEGWSGDGLCYSGGEYNVTSDLVGCAVLFKLTKQ